ncbi:hypothetical protein ABIA35_002215 [Catenulispora sp. MAP12-49]|uniref:hypothetical protein n=1 Tax=Catenulispora sp. MAP12-49 TaxID=3156302 RepID=UPI0035172885
MQMEAEQPVDDFTVPERTPLRWARRVSGGFFLLVALGLAAAGALGSWLEHDAAHGVRSQAVVVQVDGNRYLLDVAEPGRPGGDGRTSRIWTEDVDGKPKVGTVLTVAHDSSDFSQVYDVRTADGWWVPIVSLGLVSALPLWIAVWLLRRRDQS